MRERCLDMLYSASGEGEYGWKDVSLGGRAEGLSEVKGEGEYECECECE